MRVSLTTLPIAVATLCFASWLPTPTHARHFDIQTTSLRIASIRPSTLSIRTVPTPPPPSSFFLLLQFRGGGLTPKYTPDGNARGFAARMAKSSSSPSPSSPSSTSSRGWNANANANANTNSITVQDVTDVERSNDRERTKQVVDAFLTRDNRNSFIARVYAILTGQLFVTALSILGFARFPRVQSFMAYKGQVVTIGSLLLSSVAYGIMCFNEYSRRSSPIKWQLLALFTLGEALSVGFLSSFYAFETVVTAMIATAVATGSVTLYTIGNRNPKRDLSQWGAMLSSLGMIFIVYALIHLLSLFGILPPDFLPYNEAVFSLVGASLFSMYLAYHTRLVVAGKHSKFQFNEKDYVFAAMTLYSDIVNLFLYLLRLLSDRDVDR